MRSGDRALSGRALNGSEGTSGNRLPFDQAQGLRLPCAALFRPVQTGNTMGRRSATAEVSRPFP